MKNLNTLLQLKPQLSSVYNPLLSEPGEIRNFSGQLSLPVPTTDTTSVASTGLVTIRQQRKAMEVKNFQQKRSGFVTVAAAENSPMILQDRSNISRSTFPTVPLLKTSDQALITNVKAFSLYSKEQLREISQKLWLPTETAYADLELSSLNGSSASMGSNSLCSIRVLKNPNEKSVRTCYPSFTYFPVESTEKDVTEKAVEPGKKLKKTYPKKEQTKTPCQFPIIKKIEGEKYAIICNQLSDDGCCTKHEGQKPDNSKSFWPHTCQYTLIGARRGFKCGVKCNRDQSYCKSHLKSVIPADSVVRCFKVRIYPSVKEKKILHKWYGDNRAIYNLMKADDCQETFEKARATYINQLEYTKETPKEVRAFAIKEYVTGRDNANDQYNKKQAYYREDRLTRRKPAIPTMKFRVKKDQQCLTITKSAITIKDGKLRIYPNYLPNPIKLNNRTQPNKDGIIKDKKWREYIKGHPTHDIKILRTRTDKFYFCIPYDALPETPNAQGVTALDKGGRTFLTCYSPTEALMIADHKHEVFRKLRKRIKLLKETRSNGKMIRLAEAKLSNRVNDLHFQTIKYLTNNYSGIILPKFNAKSCIEHSHLAPLAKTMLQRYKHYQLDQRLKFKAQITGTSILCGSEWGTTKTCTNCFHFHPVSGEIHTCPSCGFTGDRDILASRNILIKHIKTITVFDTPSTELTSPRDS